MLEIALLTADPPGGSGLEFIRSFRYTGRGTNLADFSRVKSIIHVQEIEGGRWLDTR